MACRRAIAEDYYHSLSAFDAEALRMDAADEGWEAGDVFHEDCCPLCAKPQPFVDSVLQRRSAYPF